MGYGIFKILNPIWDSGMGFPMEEPLVQYLGVMKATTVKDGESSDPGCPAECSIHKKM